MRSQSSRPRSSSPPKDKAGSRASGTRSTRTRSPTTAGSRMPKPQFDRVIYAKDRDAVVAVEDAVREAVEPAGRRGRVQRRRGVPADRAGPAGAARPARGAHRPARRLPYVRRVVDPDRARADRARDRVPASVHPRRADRHQHDHAAARVHDRPRRRDRLLALHRHPLQTAPARRPLAARRRRRGGRVGGPRRALRRAHGCDLGHRARVLRARLRDEARHRLARSAC